MRALVTGGGGFLGSAIVRRLVERGDDVVSLTRNAYPDLDALGARTVRGDLGDADVVRGAAAGCDVVFHVAAKAGIWGPAAEFRRTNVDGTRNVLAACRAHGIPKLVHTSTPSVVHGGGDIAGGDESLPYARRFAAAYPATKAVAERDVLAAAGPELSTVALRPHLVWGPGDNHLIPGILDRARRGRLRFVAGGRSVIDSTYIDDAAQAHLDAERALGVGARCAGRAYFISQGEPLPMRDLVNRILVAAGLAPVTRSVSFPAAYAAGAVLESVFGMLRLGGEPLMTRFLARQLSTSHWFDISAARRDLGYRPAVTVAEGVARLGAHLRAGSLRP